MTERRDQPPDPYGSYAPPGRGVPLGVPPDPYGSYPPPGRGVPSGVPPDPYGSYPPPGRGVPPDPYGEYGPRDRDLPPEARGSIVTPFRVVLLIALMGSAAVAAYSLLVARGSQSIAITVAALAVLGVTTALLSLTLAAGAVRAGRNGNGGRAILGGLFGGLFALGASGALAAAVIFGLLSQA